MKLLLFSSVCNQIFDHLPVHQRLSAEEIHFQIASVSGIGDQEIQRFLSYLISSSEHGVHDTRPPLQNSSDRPDYSRGQYADTVPSQPASCAA